MNDRKNLVPLDERKAKMIERMMEFIDEHAAPVDISEEVTETVRQLAELELPKAK